jgi:formylglycine-generating enzyme required for sulfatase activity/flavodoxin
MLILAAWICPVIARGAAEKANEGNSKESANESVGGDAEGTGKMTVPDNFVLIKGGSFLMGSPESEAWRGADEKQHRVTVNDFYLARYELTQTEYQEITGQNPSSFSGQNLPVENVSWLAAITYCNARSEKEGLEPVYAIDGQTVTWNRAANGYRLPTEAEWEYACRAGTATPFYVVNSISVEDANYYGHYPYGIEDNYFSQEKLEIKPGQYRETTLPVGSFKPNKFGLFDAHGNVSEWVWDYYGEYDLEANIDPVGPTSGSLRAYRGGGWNDFAKNLRSAYRGSAPPNQGLFNVGIRLARNVAPAGGVVGAPPAIGRGQMDNKAGKVLVAFFSWSGNTRGLASAIQRQTGAELFEIKTIKAYSGDYNLVLEEARQEQKSSALPKLVDSSLNLDLYDTILLGYPNWWASIPRPIASFLKSGDFSGKKIIPFCSHGGGRLGQSVSDIAKLAPKAILGESLSVYYSGDSSLTKAIEGWLAKNGLKKK